MAEERLKPTANNWPVMGAVTDDASLEPRMLRVDPSTNRLKVDALISGATLADGVSSAILATIFDYTGSNPLAVRLTDTNGDYIAAGAGTQYSDADANADPTGTVAMGTDGTSIYALHTDTAGDLQVDLASAIPAGTNAIGKLAANSGVDIGDVDITSIAAGDNNIGNVDIASIAAGTNNIGDVDVLTVPADPFGLNADAAATAGSTGFIQAKLRLVTSQLDSIKTAVETIDNTVGGTELQVDVVGALPAGTAAIGKLSANSGVDIGDVDVTSISAGTNSIGNVGLIGRTSGGMSIFRSLDIDESEEEVKATAGQLFSITAFNTTAAPLYLKFYNLTAANTTVGTSTPVLTFLVPGNADSDGAGFVWNNDIGFAFGTAISVACTGAVADNDTTAPSANACLINLGYV